MLYALARWAAGVVPYYQRKSPSVNNSASSVASTDGTAKTSGPGGSDLGKLVQPEPPGIQSTDGHAARFVNIDRPSPHRDGQ